MDDREDFIDQMHLMILEESHLFEFPMGSVDLLPQGDVHHGPWDPGACATTLTAWHDGGLVSVLVDADLAEVLDAPDWWSRTKAVKHTQHYREVDHQDAASLLASPDSWLPGTQSGNVMVCQSELGEVAPFEDWSATAIEALRRQPAKSSEYYRRPWNELRGDQHDDWGGCVYYFWVLDGAVEQQVERYANGTTLAYDRHHVEDEYGFMTTGALAPQTEWDRYRIDLQTYQRETRHRRFNRR